MIFHISGLIDHQKLGHHREQTVLRSDKTPVTIKLLFSRSLLPLLFGCVYPTQSAGRATNERHYQGQRGVVSVVKSMLDIAEEDSDTGQQRQKECKTPSTFIVFKTPHVYSFAFSNFVETKGLFGNHLITTF